MQKTSRIRPMWRERIINPTVWLVNSISLKLNSTHIALANSLTGTQRKLVEYLTVLFGANRNRRRAGALAALRTSRQPDVVHGIRIQAGQIVRFGVGDASARGPHGGWLVMNGTHKETQTCNEERDVDCCTRRVFYHLVFFARSWRTYATTGEQLVL